MGLRRYAFLLTCVLLGAAVAVLPAVAGSETAPTVNAESNGTCGSYPNCWVPPHVELTGPGNVTFKNSSGVQHGIIWSGGPATPTCTGVPVNSSETSFNGTCSFSQTGTYTFYCAYHGPSMSGSITVNAAPMTTPIETHPGGTTPGLSPPTVTPSAPSPPTVAPAIATVALAHSQRGGLVRGSVQVPGADAHGRLEVDLLVKRGVLPGSSGSSPARVGRLVRSSVGSGTVSFSVKLSAGARAALSRRHRLQVTVKVVLTPLQGSPSAISRRVVLHV